MENGLPQADQLFDQLRPYGLPKADKLFDRLYPNSLPKADLPFRRPKPSKNTLFQPTHRHIGMLEYIIERAWGP